MPQPRPRVRPPPGAAARRVAWWQRQGTRASTPPRGSWLCLHGDCQPVLRAPAPAATAAVARRARPGGRRLSQLPTPSVLCTAAAPAVLIRRAAPGGRSSIAGCRSVAPRRLQRPHPSLPRRALAEQRAGGERRRGAAGSRARRRARRRRGARGAGHPRWHVRPGPRGGPSAGQEPLHARARREAGVTCRPRAQACLARVPQAPARQEGGQTAAGGRGPGGQGRGRGARPGAQGPARRGAGAGGRAGAALRRIRGRRRQRRRRRRRTGAPKCGRARGPRCPAPRPNGGDCGAPERGHNGAAPPPRRPAPRLADAAAACRGVPGRHADGRRRRRRHPERGRAGRAAAGRHAGERGRAGRAAVAAPVAGGYKHAADQWRRRHHGHPAGVQRRRAGVGHDPGIHAARVHGRGARGPVRRGGVRHRRRVGHSPLYPRHGDHFLGDDRRRAGHPQQRHRVEPRPAAHAGPAQAQAWRRAAAVSSSTEPAHVALYALCMLSVCVNHCRPPCAATKPCGRPVRLSATAASFHLMSFSQSHSMHNMEPWHMTLVLRCVAREQRSPRVKLGTKAWLTCACHYRPPRLSSSHHS